MRDDFWEPRDDFWEPTEIDTSMPEPGELLSYQPVYCSQCSVRIGFKLATGTTYKICDKCKERNR